ncbi:GNAT family N-acetyltransferase [Halonatronum saccharophilum]|uniref:GNAT family N-acetyltransferase n=1 Tax=Halonatronum saccharophilum TaxID=150060 RepID=UPI0004878A2A|nr:GNAT family N-acetyltransferase [Halonatronum saccharophilum]
MREGYKKIIRLPTLEEYKKICIGVTWEEYMNFDVAEAALEQSLFGVVIQYKNKIVGMGRVVGDGNIYFYIQDVAVLPEHQNKGIGKLIMNSIIKYLEDNAPEKAFVGLFAANGNESFYKRYGFNKYKEMPGIFRVINKSKSR